MVEIPYITIFSRHGRIRSGPNKGKRCPHAKCGKKPEEQSFLDCQCRKHLSWTDPLTKKQIKIKAGTRSKEEANKVKAALERKFRGEAPDPKEPKKGVLVSSACTSYIERVSKGKSPSSQKNIKNDLRHLQKFCQAPTIYARARSPAACLSASCNFASRQLFASCLALPALRSQHEHRSQPHRATTGISMSRHFMIPTPSNGPRRCDRTSRHTCVLSAKLRTHDQFRLACGSRNQSIPTDLSPFPPYPDRVSQLPYPNYASQLAHLAP